MKSRDRDHSVLSVLIVIPAYNEETKIGRVIAKIPAQIADAIVVVDDCSCDGTVVVAALAGAIVIRHDHNMGVGARFYLRG